MYVEISPLLIKVRDIWLTLITNLGDTTWLKALRNLIAGWDLVKTRSRKGLYEVINYDAALEIKDKKGERAEVNKYESIRYLQDNIFAFQDQAWGDGKILVNYRSSIGKPVDIYRLGNKHLILISLRQIKNRGDVDEFRFSWNIRQGFLKNSGFWATEISHPTERITIRVVFPKTRPPQKAFIIEKNNQRSIPLGREYFLALPNGHSEITWSCNKPTLYEQYILNWEW